MSSDNYHRTLTTTVMREGDLDSLTQAQKNRLIKFIARVAEKSYRRGVQQCQVMQPKHSLTDWRYDTPLDWSVGIDGFTTTSIDRLMMEAAYLEGLGIRPPKGYDQVPDVARAAGKRTWKAWKQAREKTA